MLDEQFYQTLSKYYSGKDVSAKLGKKLVRIRLWSKQQQTGEKTDQVCLSRWSNSRDWWRILSVVRQWWLSSIEPFCITDRHTDHNNNNNNGYKCDCTIDQELVVAVA